MAYADKKVTSVAVNSSSTGYGDVKKGKFKETRGSVPSFDVKRNQAGGGKGYKKGPNVAVVDS